MKTHTRHTLSSGKDGFSLRFYSRTTLASIVNWIFDSGPIGSLAAYKRMPYRISSIMIRPLAWGWVDGALRFTLPITPVDALHLCWAHDFSDEQIEFFWAMGTSLRWEEAVEHDDLDVAMTLKALLNSQGFDEMGERLPV